MWRKHFAWIKYLGTKSKKYILVELQCVDGNTYYRFAETVGNNQMYVKLKIDNKVEEMRLYVNMGSCINGFIKSWKIV